jgi:hypothetical protein
MNCQQECLKPLQLTFKSLSHTAALLAPNYSISTAFVQLQATWNSLLLSNANAYRHPWAQQNTIGITKRTMATRRETWKNPTTLK